MNIVKTENGYVSGTINGEYGKKVSIFCVSNVPA
jgi:hypothetical protein